MNEELKVVISAEIGKLKSGIQEAKSEVGSFKSEISKSKDTISKAWNSVGEGCTKASKTIMTGVAGIGTALVGTSALTAEYRVGMDKLTTAFETAGASAETAKGTYNDLYRVLGDSDVAVEAANHLAKMTTNEKELSEWTNICKGVYATFGDSLPIEGLTEASNETAKVGTVTGSLADALNWAGVSEDDFNAKLAACNSEAEREALIRETLSGLYDDAADKYEKTAASTLAQNEAHAKLTESLAQLGEAITPVVTMFTELATQALAAVVPYIQQLAEQYGPQLKEVLQGIGEFIKPIAEFIMAHLPAIATIAGIIMGIAAAYQVVSAALTVYNTIKTAYTTITTIATAAQTAFAAANIAALAPILAVVAAIAAVVAIIVVCVKNWDKIKETVVNVAKAISEKVKEMVDKVVGFFGELGSKISAKVEEIKTAVSNKFNDIKTAISEKVQAAKEAVVNKFTEIKTNISNKVNEAKTAVVDKFNEIKSAISEKVQAAKEAVTTKFNEIKTNISEKLSAAKEIVVNKFTEIKTNITTKLTEAKNVVTEKFNQIKSDISEKLSAAKEAVVDKFNQIKSDMSEKLSAAKEVVVDKFNQIKSSMSEKMSDAKKAVSNALSNIKEGFSSKLSSAKEAVSSSMNSIKDKFSNIMDKAKDIVKSALDKMKGFFKFKWELPKIKLPHFSVSGKFSLNPPQIPHFSVSWYKLGGIFDSPHLFSYGGGIGGLGEDGAEAVVPLEKNTKWLDRLAEMLNDKQGGGNRPIILQVDGKTFAEIAVDSINDLTRQRGSCSLRLV